MSYGGARRASAACFEYRVDLRAVLYDFPGADKAGGDHERVPRSEAAALAAGALNGDTPRGHHAQLVLGVTHAPFAAARRPAAGEELLAGVGEEIAHQQLWCAADQALRRQFGHLSFHPSVQGNDGSAHERAAQVLMPGNSSANARRGPAFPRRAWLAPLTRPGHGGEPGRSSEVPGAPLRAARTRSRRGHRLRWWIRSCRAPR